MLFIVPVVPLNLSVKSYTVTLIFIFFILMHVYTEIHGNFYYHGLDN